ncbi:hypothetical protein [Nitrospira sp. Nam80]
MPTFNDGEETYKARNNLQVMLQRGYNGDRRREKAKAVIGMSQRRASRQQSITYPSSLQHYLLKSCNGKQYQHLIQ